MKSSWDIYIERANRWNKEWDAVKRSRERREKELKKIGRPKRLKLKVMR